MGLSKTGLTSVPEAYNRGYLKNLRRQGRSYYDQILVSVPVVLEPFDMLKERFENIEGPK